MNINTKVLMWCIGIVMGFTGIFFASDAVATETKEADVGQAVCATLLITVGGIGSIVLATSLPDIE